MHIDQRYTKLQHTLKGVSYKKMFDIARDMNAMVDMIVVHLVDGTNTINVRFKKFRSFMEA